MKWTLEGLVKPIGRLIWTFVRRGLRWLPFSRGRGISSVINAICPVKPGNRLNGFQRVRELGAKRAQLIMALIVLVSG